MALIETVGVVKHCTEKEIETQRDREYAILPLSGIAEPSDTCGGRHTPSLHSNRRAERSERQTAHPDGKEHVTSGSS